MSDFMTNAELRMEAERLVEENEAMRETIQRQQERIAELECELAWWKDTANDMYQYVVDPFAEPLRYPLEAGETHPSVRVMAVVMGMSERIEQIDEKLKRALLAESGLQKVCFELTEQMLKRDELIRDLFDIIDCDACPMYCDACWVKPDCEPNPCRLEKRISELGIEVFGK